MTATLSLAQARRIALAAQGFADRMLTGTPDRRALRRVFGRVGIIQMDSVNVLVRSHYLPVFSRLGPYAPEVLDRAAYGKRRDLFEYWAHEASLVPLATHPLLRWRMERASSNAWDQVRRIQAEKPGFVDSVRQQVADRGPATAGDLAEPRSGRAGPWWDWDDTKAALEWMFYTGEVTTAARRGFERVYDLAERVLPAEILRCPTPTAADAQRGLVRIAASSYGIATEKDLRDYFRLSPGDAREAIAALVEDGGLLPVTVESWKQVAYLDPAARMPQRVRAAALVSPFDSLVWERSRAERLFGFRYRIEIYTPKHKRVHGYFVLPFLLGDRLVARVDLKSDRAARVLLVHAAHLDEGFRADLVAPALARELWSLAGWLGLDDVVVGTSGDLAAPLEAEVRAADLGGQACTVSG